MVRIIGRIELAEEVRRALGAAGIDSYVVTGGPRAAAAAAGKDGSEADVLFSDRPDLATCAFIKRNARHRPVVLVTRAKHERRVLAHMRGSAVGPDAHVVWPATGEELNAAIARALAVAPTARPRLPGGELPGKAMAGIGLALGVVALALKMLGVDTRLIGDAIQVLGVGLLGAGWWLGAPYSPTRRLDRIFGGAMLLLAALGLVVNVGL